MRVPETDRLTLVSALRLSPTIVRTPSPGHGAANARGVRESTARSGHAKRHGVIGETAHTISTTGPGVNRAADCAFASADAKLAAA
jgi:hypothetical protein